MAIRESLLNTINSIATSDFVRAVTYAGASSKVTVSNLAKSIIENYTGSTLGGTAQSVKSAIDSIQSTISTHVDADYFAEQGWYYTRIGAFWIVFAKPSYTVTGSYSASTGLYFATSSFALPTSIKDRLAGKTANIQLTTESGGIYDATMVSYDASTCSGTFYISANAAFTNATVPVYVLITAI